MLIARHPEAILARRFSASIAYVKKSRSTR